jgi:hypothetical protein
MYQVEKNIPLSSKYAYPFDKMADGDSFFIPCTDDKKISYIRAQINSLKYKYPTKVISTRKEEGGLRIWLLAKERI